MGSPFLDTRPTLVELVYQSDRNVWRCILSASLAMAASWSEVAPKALVNVLHAEHTIGVTLLAVWVMGMMVVASFRLLGMLRLQRIIAGCRLVTQSERASIEKAAQLRGEQTQSAGNLALDG